MTRAIDSEAAYRFLSEQLVKETGAFSKGVNKGLNIARSAMRNPDAIPTLTPPNEAPPCYQPDGDGCVYQCYDGDDEPIDKCKECPLCYSDKQRHHTPPNKWVAVEERLPEEKQRVIVRCEHVGTSVGWILWGNWMTDIGPGAGNVTHWMPLPAPPDRRPPEGEA